MDLKAGDQITYRLEQMTGYHEAIVLSMDDSVIILQLRGDAPADIRAGQDLVIPEPGTDRDYYNEIISREDDILRCRRLWVAKRGYFRVDDVFPVLYRKVPDSSLRSDAKLFSAYDDEMDDCDTHDDPVDPRLWKMLVTINARLGLILTRLNLESEGMVNAQNIPVNISATGLRFTVNLPYEVGDIMEIKMLLPAEPPVGIMTFANVTRVERLRDGGYYTSLNYLNMDEAVRDIIIQYTLKRQREIIRGRRKRGAST